MSNNIQFAQIKQLAEAFDNMRTRVVFVGGSIVSCYVDRPTAGIRPTDDIDVIVEVLNYAKRSELEENLRKNGFAHHVESGIACRYLYKQIVVDIMPTDEPSINFKNIWYQYGFEHAVSHMLEDSMTIRILNAPCFIATKLEAFKGRGNSDGRTSHDFEDIVFVLENRTSIWEELDTADKNLRDYLVFEFQHLHANQHLTEWIEGHVERGFPPATEQIMQNIRKFISGV